MKISFTLLLANLALCCAVYYVSAAADAVVHDQSLQEKNTSANPHTIQLEPENKKDKAIVIFYKRRDIDSIIDDDADSNELLYEDDKEAEYWNNEDSALFHEIDARASRGRGKKRVGPKKFKGGGKRRKNRKSRKNKGPKKARRNRKIIKNRGRVR